MLIGAIGNRQGFLPKGYPEYAGLYRHRRQALPPGPIKMNEFVTLCGRDWLPIVWFQDTPASTSATSRKAEMLGLGHR